MQAHSTKGVTKSDGSGGTKRGRDRVGLKTGSILSTGTRLRENYNKVTGTEAGTETGAETGSAAKIEMKIRKREKSDIGRIK